MDTEEIINAFKHMLDKENRDKKLKNIENHVKALLNRIKPVKVKYSSKLDEREGKQHICQPSQCDPENERMLIKDEKLSSHLSASYHYKDDKGNMVRISHDAPCMVKLRTEMYVCNYGYVHLCSDQDADYEQVNQRFNKSSCYIMEAEHGRIYCGISNKHVGWKSNHAPYGHIGCEIKGGKRGRGRGRGRRGRRGGINRKSNKTMISSRSAVISTTTTTEDKTNNKIIQEYNQSRKRKLENDNNNNDSSVDDDNSVHINKKRKREEKSLLSTTTPPLNNKQDNAAITTVKVLTIPIAHKKEKNGLGVRRRVMGKARRKKRNNKMTRKTRGNIMGKVYTSVKKRKDDGYYFKNLTLMDDVESSTKNKNDDHSGNLTISPVTTTIIIKKQENNNVRSKMKREREEGNKEQKLSSSSSLVTPLKTKPKSLLYSYSSSNPSPSVLSTETMTRTTAAFSLLSSFEQKTDFKLNAKKIIITLFYSNIRTCVYDEHIQKEHNNIKKIIKRLYNQQKKMNNDIINHFDSFIIYQNNKINTENGGGGGNDGRNGNNREVKVEHEYKRTPRLIINEHFIEFFCNVAWAQWELVVNSPHGKKPSVRLNPTSICLALLYMIRQGGKCMNNRQIIPSCDYATKYTPPVKDLEAYGFPGHNITTGTGHLHGAYYSLLNNPNENLPFDQLQAYQWVTINQ